MSDREPPTFLQLVEQLTAPHLQTVGEITQTVEGLLQQLRDAIFLGLETGGAGSAFGSRMPLDASSADLLDEIDRQAAEALVAVSHQPVPFGTTESYVRLWAGQTSESKLFTVTVRQTVDNPEKVWAATKGPTVFNAQQQVSAFRLVQSWVDRIDDLFNPPSTREIRAKCPACDARYVSKVKDGAHVRGAALNFHRDREERTISARCSACTVSWAPSQFDWLAGAIGSTLEGMMKWAEERQPKRRAWGEKTDLPEGSYRLEGDRWVDSLTGNWFPDDMSVAAGRIET